MNQRTTNLHLMQVAGASALDSLGGAGRKVRQSAMDQFSRANIKAQLSYDIAQHEIEVNQKRLARYREVRNICCGILMLRPPCSREAFRIVAKKLVASGKKMGSTSTGF